MSEETAWKDCRELRIEGKGWSDTLSFYDRLPGRAKGTVRDPVWDLGQHSAGICCRFVTDAPAIQARWSLRFESLAMHHMPATGVSGLDLYVRTAGVWRWAGFGAPTQYPTNAGPLVANVAPGAREYLLYLPLYNGVTSVEVGVPAGCRLEPGPTRPETHHRPVVFYGTSITQGGCASRPGMAHVAILGRWLDRPVINLGFSGNGTMDLSVAELLAELDPAVYVIDCLPNMHPELVAERTPPLVAAIRRARPRTPIVLVEDRTYGNAYLVPGGEQVQQGMRAALRAVYDDLALAGDRHLHYQPGPCLLGDDDEGTVDASHPTDLGFHRQAAAMLPLLQGLVTG